MIDPRLAALTEADRLAADLAALRIEHEAVRGRLTHTRRERDDARDETRRLWDATEADRARMAELESRPTYEDGVRASAIVVACAPMCPTEGECYACDRARDILTLLEPKP